MSTRPRAPDPNAHAGVRPGDAVLTRDREQFAHVKSVRGSYFELDVAQRGDFWLSNLYVASADDGCVVLNVSRDEVYEHRLNAPGIDAAEFHDQLDAGVLDDEETLAQRERMERELERQRERMDLPPEDTATAGTAVRGAVSDGDESQRAVSAAEIDEEREEIMEDVDPQLGLRVEQ